MRGPFRLSEATLEVLESRRLFHLGVEFSDRRLQNTASFETAVQQPEKVAVKRHVDPIL